MKEATGELNMTVITVLVIAALGVIGTTVILPAISGGMRNSSCKSMLGTGDKASDDKIRAVSSGGSWYCCPTGTYSAANCQKLEQ